MAAHTLAEATVYGFGLAQQSRRARLVVRTDNHAIHAAHELQRRAGDGLEWHTEASASIDPRDTRDRVHIQPGYSEFPDARLVCEWHAHAPRAYVYYQEGSDWTERLAWETHPATGVELTHGSLQEVTA
ncbi:hypothetical protein HZS55_15670 [Halosimplex rubrum]|uniref:Uncharacterized protein n=1 Tax=Halosimplex rubrum TaxID=869889 RepID=A0A7D5P6M7_9EURY|nr:hypothetical protein [Halosimplex rubrum]QLH78638.1 hypothetical protein HZS55_15670 [Halosimplex rubrum]